MAKSHPRWRLAKKVLTWLFFIAVVVLLVVYAKKVDWGDVWTVIRDYNRTALLSAVGLVIVSYLLYGCYDLLGRLYCGHIASGCPAVLSRAFSHSALPLTGWAIFCLAASFLPSALSSFPTTGISMQARYEFSVSFYC